MNLGLTTLLISLILSSGYAQKSVVGVARIIDGDTLELLGQRVRLFGLDAPEYQQLCEDARGVAYSCGRTSTGALEAKIAGRSVTCVVQDTDIYGRLVAKCSLEGEDLNGWLVRQGWAVAYLRFGQDYLEAERSARTSHRGLWSGRFQWPESYRRHALSLEQLHAATFNKANVYYPNCNEVWQAHLTQLTTEQPGYRMGLDANQNGTACEEKP